MQLGVNNNLCVCVGETHDVFCYANLLYMTGQYHRALHHLRSHHIDKVVLCGCFFVPEEFVLFACH